MEKKMIEWNRKIYYSKLIKARKKSLNILIMGILRMYSKSSSNQIHKIIIIDIAFAIAT